VKGTGAERAEKRFSDSEAVSGLAKQEAAELSVVQEVGVRERSNERAGSTINFKIVILKACETIRPQLPRSPGSRAVQMFKNRKICATQIPIAESKILYR
jgi:hypothetical protein